MPHLEFGFPVENRLRIGFALGQVPIERQGLRRAFFTLSFVPRETAK
jgi:hypothetical protein